MDKKTIFKSLSENSKNEECIDNNQMTSLAKKLRKNIKYNSYRKRMLSPVKMKHIVG